MTDRDHRVDQDRLDDNLDRLLQLGEPAPRMPEQLKSSIRSRLAGIRPETGRVRTITKRWAGWTLAAAAALTLFLIVFWPGGPSGAVSWADILEQLERIRSVAARIHAETSGADGRLITHDAKIFFKDPGCSRTELFGSSPNEPESIMVFKREPGLAEMLTLYPGGDRAERVTLTWRTDGPEPADKPIVDFVSESWNRLKRITAEEATPIGERVLDGTAAVGFESPAKNFFGSAEGPAGEGRLRIWVGRDSAVPLLIELEFQDGEGPAVRTEISDIRWNVPLEDSLFDLTVPVDWQLSRTLIDTAEYVDTRLAAGVTLEAGPDGQDPLALTRDVIRVVRGEELTRPGSDAPDVVRVFVELTPEAAQRLRAFADRHPAQLMVVNFDGELNVVPHLDETHRERIDFDLSRLGLSLAELESRYFTSQD